jgi:hypothetical protein
MDTTNFKFVAISQVTLMEWEEESEKSLGVVYTQVRILAL